MTRIPLTGRLGTFTWRMLATVLAGQALVIFLGALVARGTASAQGSAHAQTLLWGGCALGVLAIVAAGLMRGPLGLPMGWLVQVLTVASAVVVPTMLVVGLIFTGLWLLCLIKGQQVDAMMAARESGASDAGAAR